MAELAIVDRDDRQATTADGLIDRVRDVCLMDALHDLGPAATDEQVVALATGRLLAILARLADHDLAGRLRRLTDGLRTRRVEDLADWRRLVTPLDGAVHALRQLERAGQAVSYCPATRPAPAEILSCPPLECGLARGHDSDHATILRHADGEVSGPGFTWPQIRRRR